MINPRSKIVVYDWVDDAMVLKYGKILVPLIGYLGSTCKNSLIVDYRLL